MLLGIAPSRFTEEGGAVPRGTAPYGLLMPEVFPVNHAVERGFIAAISDNISGHIEDIRWPLVNLVLCVSVFEKGLMLGLVLSI